MHLGDLVMPDRFRTALVRFAIEHLARPRRLLIRACFWLAAQTDDLEEKRRRQNTVLELDPENEPASLALLLFDRRRSESQTPLLATQPTSMLQSGQVQPTSAAQYSREVHNESEATSGTLS